MSFGFSVGDFIGAANLTYKLIAALRENNGAGEEFRAAIDELGCYQAALMRVSYLERNRNIPRDTFDAASHMVMQSMEMIQSYLDQTKKYDQKLGRTESSGFKYGVRKIRWALLKAEDMKKLRETLQRRNAALQLLLQCAGLYAICISENKLGEADTPRETEDSSSKLINDSTEVENTPVVDKSAGMCDDGVPPSVAQTHNNAPRIQAVVELTETPSDPGSNSSQLFSLSSFSADQLRALISNQTSREAEIRTLGSLLRTILRLGEYQLSGRDNSNFMDLLDVLCQSAEEGELHTSASVKAPIKFKDAIGRKFSFPWHLCKIWTDMEELIKLAFVHVDIISPLVHKGSYDLVGPGGEEVLPHLWETVVRPGMAITMHMWPMPKQPPKETNTSQSISPPPPPPFGSDLAMPHLSLYSPGKTTIRSHGRHKPKKKPAPGGFFAWAAGGNARSGLQKSGNRRGVSVEEVSDSDSGCFESAIPDNAQRNAFVRQISDDPLSPISAPSTSSHSNAESHSSDDDSDTSSLQSTVFVANVDAVIEPDKLSRSLGQLGYPALLTKAADLDDEISPKRVLEG